MDAPGGSRSIDRSDEGGAATLAEKDRERPRTKMAAQYARSEFYQEAQR